MSVRGQLSFELMIGLLLSAGALALIAPSLGFAAARLENASRHAQLEELAAIVWRDSAYSSSVFSAYVPRGFCDSAANADLPTTLAVDNSVCGAAPSLERLLLVRTDLGYSLSVAR